MNISIAGKILRDKADNTRRNYESFVISVVETTKFAKHEQHIHISNYAANGRSAAHKMTAREYDSSAEALKASSELIKRKLDRDRVEIDSFAESFSDSAGLIGFITKKGLKLTIAQIATIKNSVSSFVARVASSEAEFDASNKEEHFMASIEKQLDEDALLAMEERSGFGKSTKEANSSKWGLF